MNSVQHLTHVEEFSNHDNARFNFNGTAQPCNAFKINNFLTNLNFAQPEGDLDMRADYKVSIPHATDPRNNPPTIRDLGMRMITLPASVTMLDNARDYFAVNNTVGSLVVFSASPRYQEVNLRFEIPMDVLNPDPNPDPVPPSASNVSTLTVPNRTDAKRLGFNPTDEPMV